MFAFFGSYGLYRLNWDGEVQWENDLGKMQTKHGHGEGSSPVLHDDILVVNWDHEGQSFLVAFDTNTGKRLWKADRDVPTSWSSPIVAVEDSAPSVIVNGTNRIRGYNIYDGSVIWECGGLSDNIVASPVRLAVKNGLGENARSTTTLLGIVAQKAQKEGDLFLRLLRFLWPKWIVAARVHFQNQYYGARGNNLRCCGADG